MVDERTKASTEDRFVGCLLGVAIGDALGMPVEGWPREAIQMHYGLLSDFQPSPPRALRAGQFTDDTQMMLIHAESIVATGRIDGDDLARRFVGWLRSGDVRGIGGSTLQSVRRLERGIHWSESGQTGEFAAGNGVAMRISPVGLFDCRHIERLEQDVRTAGAITHRNPEALAGGLAVAYAVARLATAQTQPTALIEEMVAFIGDSEVARNLQRAQRLLDSDVPAPDALATLGTSGYVVHTVGSAFYCFVRTPGNFKQTLIEAVMAGHDTDTTGAVAGALSGAHNGLQGILQRWLDQVEDREHIEGLAREISALALRSNATKG
jgi:ADP-ribosyl-[dinitrogen reductase] hydrolase